jgi:hypothetical protein
MDSIREKIELLFESRPLLGLKYDPNIKSETQYELIANISYFDQDGLPNWELIAGRMSPFFDCVILLKNSRVVDLYFQNQKIDHPVWAVNMIWPQSEYLSVLKADMTKLMNKIFVEKIFDTAKHSAFMVNLGKLNLDDFKMVLVSSTAEPWLTLQIQVLKNALEKINFSVDD